MRRLKKNKLIINEVFVIDEEGVTFKCIKKYYR